MGKYKEKNPLTAPYRVLGLVFKIRTMTKGKQPPDIDLPATSNSHSPSADSDTESYLLERGAEALPLTQGAFHHFDWCGRSSLVVKEVIKGKPRVNPRSLLPV